MFLPIINVYNININNERMALIKICVKNSNKLQ